MARARPVGSFPPEARVRRSADFLRAKAVGIRVRTPHFVLVLAPLEPGTVDAGPRLGVVASRRIGNAVTRNRAKRLVREAFRATRDLFNPRLSLIVIVTRPTENMKLDDVVAEWREQSARIRRRGRESIDRATKDSSCTEASR